jgi:hypothetical protein
VNVIGPLAATWTPGSRNSPHLRSPDSLPEDTPREALGPR